jgi:hypothetical protein
MGLTNSEVTRIKSELGFNVLATASQQYVGGYLFMFEQVIQPYIDEADSTTCATPVAASTTPTPRTLTLGDASGVAAGDTVIVDIDTRQERATVQSKSGNDITCLLSKEHSGTYPVAVESGVTIVRDILQKIADVKTTIASIRSRVGIKKAEDIEFFGGGATLASQGIDALTQVMSLLEHWRDELASALGVTRLNGESSGGGSSISVY